MCIVYCVYNTYYIVYNELKMQALQMVIDMYNSMQATFHSSLQTV